MALNHYLLISIAVCIGTGGFGQFGELGRLHLGQGA